MKKLELQKIKFKSIGLKEVVLGLVVAFIVAVMFFVPHTKAIFRDDYRKQDGNVIYETVVVGVNDKITQIHTITTTYNYKNVSKRSQAETNWMLEQNLNRYNNLSGIRYSYEFTGDDYVETTIYELANTDVVAVLAAYEIFEDGLVVKHGGDYYISRTRLKENMLKAGYWPSVHNSQSN